MEYIPNSIVEKRLTEKAESERRSNSSPIKSSHRKTAGSITRTVSQNCEAEQKQLEAEVAVLR